MANMGNLDPAQLAAFLRTQPPGYMQQDQSANLITTGVTFIVLASIATILRFVACRLKRLSVRRADGLMILSYVAQLAVCTACMLTTRWGVGRHIFALPAAWLEPYLLSADMGVALTYLFAVTFPKLAIIDLYLRIFVTNPSLFITRALGILIILNSALNLPVILAHCVPVQADWDKSVGGCIHISLYWAVGSIFNIVTDLVMFILPIPVILALQAHRGVKLSVGATFCVGSLGLITSIIRFVQFIQYSELRNTLEGKDQTWFATNILIWTIVEPGVYHLTASSLSLRPLASWIVRQGSSLTPLARRRWYASSIEALGGSRKPKASGSGDSSSAPDRSTNRALHWTEQELGQPPMTTPIRPPMNTPIRPPMNTPIRPPMNTPILPPMNTPVEPLSLNSYR